MGGRFCVLFFFSFSSLASFFNIALIANQILSLWYGKNHVPTMVFLELFGQRQQCWLKKIFPSLFTLSLAGQYGMTRTCAIFIPSFPRPQVHMYIYIWTYIYIYIYIYHMFNFLLPFWLLGRDLQGKRGGLVGFVLFLSSLASIVKTSI